MERGKVLRKTFEILVYSGDPLATSKSCGMKNGMKSYFHKFYQVRSPKARITASPFSRRALSYLCFANNDAHCLPMQWKQAFVAGNNHCQISLACLDENHEQIMLNSD
jgi:hypothetical protein